MPASVFHIGSSEYLRIITDGMVIGIRGGGAGGGAVAPPVAKIFGQNAWDSGKSVWDKIYIDSNIYFHIELKLTVKVDVRIVNLFDT